MHGLLNYGLATGGLGPTPGLLFNELSDFLAAKTEGDRDSAERAVNLILAHGNVFGDKEQTTDDINDRVLTQFEAITDPEECSRFYSKKPRRDPTWIRSPQKQPILTSRPIYL